MYTNDVIAHFGSGYAVARALGITASAVYQWGDVVPLLRALQLEAITRRKLRVDRQLYGFDVVA